MCVEWVTFSFSWRILNLLNNVVRIDHSIFSIHTRIIFYRQLNFPFKSESWRLYLYFYCSKSTIFTADPLSVRYYSPFVSIFGNFENYVYSSTRPKICCYRDYGFVSLVPSLPLNSRLLGMNKTKCIFTRGCNSRGVAFRTMCETASRPEIYLSSSCFAIPAECVRGRPAWNLHSSRGAFCQKNSRSTCMCLRRKYRTAFARAVININTCPVVSFFSFLFIYLFFFGFFVLQTHSAK